nr:amidohydrolase family protein [Anaerolineae bacterium]
MGADIVLYNGRIVTQDDNLPEASAIAIQEGRIIATSATGDLCDLLAPGGEAIDLEGRLVIPGLVDAHVHLSWYAHFLHNVDLTVATSAQHAVELVARQADSLE